MSPSAASAATKAGSFFSSPAWKRVFSRHRMSPGFIASTAASAFSPMQSSANATGRLRTRATAAGDQASATASDRVPWDGRNGRAGSPCRPCRRSRRWSERRARCGSRPRPCRSRTGTLRSTRSEHALALEVGLVERAKHDYRPACEVSTRPLPSVARSVANGRGRSLVPDGTDAIATAAQLAGWDQISLPIATAVSTMRLEKPHSLSYHDITRTSVPSITLVWSMAKTDECGSWLKSLETLGASV